MARMTLVVAAVLAASTPAFAQEFGRNWIERITHQMQMERGPLEGRPVEVQAQGGVQYQFDSNLFLLENNEEEDSIIIPFARVNIEYVEENLSLVADGMFNYKFYTDFNDINDHEERVYLSARQTDERYSFQISEIFRRYSDPFDVLGTPTVAQDHIARMVSDTIGQVSFDFTEQFFFEANGTFQVVRWQDAPFENIMDNNQARVDGAFGWRSPVGWDLLAQVGWYSIMFSEEETNGFTPPDSDGIYFRGGIRGDLLQDLAGEILVGYTNVESDAFAVPPTSGGAAREHSTMDVSAQLRYEATETFTVTAGYTRMATTAALVKDPWEVIDRILLRAIVQASEQIDFFARGRYTHTSSALGIKRDYYDVGGGFNWRLNDYFLFDASVTFRSGETEGAVAATTEWDSFIVSAGLAFTY